MNQYKVEHDGYVGSSYKVVDSKTNSVIRQFDPWTPPYDTHTALFAAKQFAKHLNEMIESTK